MIVQEITLWRKGERVRKLPLANSLYQQHHALARHDAGDQPTEGVRVGGDVDFVKKKYHR